MKLVNLTGHDLRLGNSSTLLRGTNYRKARVHGEMNQIGEVDVGGLPRDVLPILEVVEREILNLPAPHEGTIYIVSGIVAAAAQRLDVLAPGKTTRAGEGRVTSCHAFLIPRPMSS